MIIQCPHCGGTVTVNNLGRKRVNVPVENILDSLRKRKSVAVAAQELGCSRGHVYDVLKANGLRLKDVVSQ